MSMRATISIVAALLMLSPLAGKTADIETCFTPGGSCVDVIVHQVGMARRQVLVQAYSFTSAAVVKAIIDAKRRGVDVRAILDKSNVCRDDGPCTKKSAIAADTLMLAGIPVLVDFQHPIAHNKIIVIDDATVMTGSYNFSAQAERNAENLLVINDDALLIHPTARKHAVDANNITRTKGTGFCRHNNQDPAHIEASGLSQAATIQRECDQVGHHSTCRRWGLCAVIG